ncbi:hypothetical protein SAVIM338S_00066 [Streptomyces avidinii]
MTRLPKPLRMHGVNGRPPPFRFTKPETSPEPAITMVTDTTNWSSKIGATSDDVDRFWQAFLRCFDLEHTFRVVKQTLGWISPKLHTPEAAECWTWILSVAHTRLRLARPLAADLRRLWEKPSTPDRIIPVRVRRGFRNIRPHLACPCSQVPRRRPRTAIRRKKQTPGTALRRRQDRQTPRNPQFGRTRSLRARVSF